MMKKMTFREIKQSLGRYFAIFAIVALGVGFFSGLKVTKEIMVVSADDYLKDNQLFDYRLLNTLGFEKEDVDALAAKEDVRAVAGAVSADILYVDAANNVKAIRAHSMTEGVNGLALVAGRLPESADECVADSLYFNESAIGSKIVFAENNAEEDLENFTYREYTITGIVQASVYTQFERGNTSLGNGQINGFVYLLPEGFQMEYYTEIYVKFNEDARIYSEEYDAYMEEKEPLWEAYCKEQAMRRYDSIVAKAEEELADAEAEFSEKKMDAEAEFADAKKELDDAKAEIADGEKEIADGEKELADAKKTIAEKEQELKDAEQTVSENEELLKQKWADYYNGKASYENGKNAIAANRKELDAGAAKIAEIEKQFAETQALIDGMLNSGDAAQIAQAELMQKELDAMIAQADLDTQKAKLQAGYAQLAGVEAQLENAHRQLESGKLQLEEADRELADAKQKIADGWPELEKGKKEIEDAEAELADGRKELEDGKKELADGIAEYNDAYKEYEEEIADAEEELADARQKIADIEKPESYVLGRNTNIGYACFDNDSSIVEGIANVFPVFFFLVAALVCMTTMNRMVEEQRTQIGVLKALGYSEAAIMGKFLFYSGSAAFTGCVAGYFLGTRMFPFVIWQAYGLLYRLGDIHYVFDLKMFLISLTGAFLCSVGTTWVSCRKEFKETAANLMRPKAPKAGKRVFLEYLPFIWKRLKFLQKVSVRNILRYKKRFFMMIVGISGCTALLVTGFGVRDSVTGIADRQFDKIQLMDFGFTLKEKDTDITKAAAIIEEAGGTYARAMEGSLDFVKQDEIKSVNLVVAEHPEGFEAYINLHTPEGAAVAYPKDGEAVICEKLSELYGIKPGDVITLQNDKQQKLQVKVSAICENYVYNYVYLNAATYEGAFGAPIFKNVYVNLPEDETVDVHTLSARIMQLDNVMAVSVNDDIRERFNGMMSSMNYIVFVIIACAAALAFIVLYNLNNINITERIREIATIKVLGFYRKETAAYVFRENIVLTAVGCGVGLVLGRFLHLFVMHEIKIDMVSFDTTITILSYFLSIVLTFFFNWIVNRMMLKKLDRINMAESLKAID